MPSLSGLLEKYVGHKGADPPPPPPITTRGAIGILVVYTLIYVIPFYLSSTTRPSPDLSRDAPSVIRARITAVSVACTICSVATFLLLTGPGHAPIISAAHLMGYWPVGIAETGRALGLTMVLFLGPLFEYFIVEAGWRQWLSLVPPKTLFSEITAWRSIVAGPVTEEILFRSAGVPLLLVAHATVSQTIFLSPVVFGLAHVHHFYEFRITHPGVPATAALVRSAFQFAYTTLFGAYATFVFLRTGSLLAVCVVHAFCNCMGLPRLWGKVQRSNGEGAAPAGGDAAAKPQGGWLISTVCYYVLLVTGAVLFYKNLWGWTNSALELLPIKA